MSSNYPFRIDLDEDYEALYKIQGWRPDPYTEHGSIPVGYLDRMCHEDEMQEREKQKRLSRFEIKPDTNPPQVDKDLAMTEYRRAAAGREMSHPMKLRPWSVLRRGLRHLLLDICLRDEDWLYISGFVFDRLKSIRQEMIIQQIEGRRYIEVLEGSARFLIYSMYRLTCATKDYLQDHNRVVLSPKGTAVSGLDNYETNVLIEMKLTLQCLRDCLHSLIVQYQDNVPDSPNRETFESINMIVNIPQLCGHRVVSTDFMSNSELFQRSPLFKTVFVMRRYHVISQHLTALKRLPSLKDSPLIILTYAFLLPLLQMDTMTRLKKASASRGPNKTSVHQLCDILCPEWLSDGEERSIFTLFIALQYGVRAKDTNSMNFTLAKTVTKEKVDWLHEKLPEQQDSDNETRIYALQMILGRQWTFFYDLLKCYGIECILDPTNLC